MNAEERERLKQIIDDNPQPEQVWGEPTVLDPIDSYQVLYNQPDICRDFYGIETISQVDAIVKGIYKQEHWPKHLKEELKWNTQNK